MAIDLHDRILEAVASCRIQAEVPAKVLAAIGETHVLVARSTLDEMVAHAVTVSEQSGRNMSTVMWWDGVANGIDRVRQLDAGNVT